MRLYVQEEEMYVSVCACWVQWCISFVVLNEDTEIFKTEGLAYIGDKI